MTRPTLIPTGILPLFLALSLGACGDASRVAAPPAATLRMTKSTDAGETGYFNGTIYKFQFPSQNSNNQNELIVDCFRLGSDINGHANGPRAVLYAIFLPGASMHSCPDGSIMHDHLLSAVPGSPGYATQWELKEVWPGDNFIPSIVPIKSNAALQSAVDLGQVIVLDDEIVLHLVVTGPVR